MLEITVSYEEQWDEDKELFIPGKTQTLRLEHSLVSLSKWESKWCKPFLNRKDESPEDTLDYIKCMTLTQNVDPDVYNHLSRDNLLEIKQYIESPMTATTITDNSNAAGRGRETLTSELLYYYMIALNIPFECQKWHLNRLVTLIRVCSIKNQPPKKMGKGEVLRRNAELNAARRAQMNTKG